MLPNTPAWQIVFEALKPDPDSEKLELIVAEHPDENELLSICQDHGILLIVNQGLRGLHHNIFSADGQERWRSAVATYTLLSLTMHRELQRLLKLSTAANIPVVPFKGPILSERLYGDSALRMSAALDLLVPAGQVCTMVTLLIDEGYLPTFKSKELQQWIHPGSQENHCILQHPSGRWMVEVHWQLFDSWRGLQSSEVSSALGEGDAVETLLYLCIHGAAHWWIQLKWVVDVDRCARRMQALDWEDLFARARERGCARVVRLALFLARQCCGLEMPESVTVELQADPKVASLARRVAKFWPPPATFQPSLLWKLGYLLACRERFSDKAAMIINYPLSRSLPF